MKDLLQELSQLVEEFGSVPKLEDMPKKTLADKGIDGPTAAHTIEEVHTPLNLAYLTFTTGSSAFQNIVGVTHAEIPERIKASILALEKSGVKPGDKILFTYPPLVNVFSNQALKKYGVSWCFLKRSSRDAFLAALYDEQPNVIVGESSFLRVALEDAEHMGIAEKLPKEIKILTAGTPLDLELFPIAQEVLEAEVHDLYGCQEFGWLAVDGCLLRKDIELVPLATKKNQTMYELVVGGLPMGDSFPVSETGHVCNKEGKLITYRRERTYPEYEVVIKETTLSSSVTAQRVARTILRIKGRIVKVSPDLVIGAKKTVLELVPDTECKCSEEKFQILGPEKTRLFDDLVQAQIEYQQNSKADPVWMKKG